MLIEIYILTWIFAILFMVLGFTFHVFKKDVLIFFFLAALLFFVIGTISFNIEKSYCDYDTSWSCYTDKTSSIPLGYLGYGLGLLLFATGVIYSIWIGGEEVIKRAED